MAKEYPAEMVYTYFNSISKQAIYSKIYCDELMASRRTSRPFTNQIAQSDSVS